MKIIRKPQHLLLFTAIAIMVFACKKDDNLAPEIVVSEDIIGMTGQTINLSATASDPDGDALEFTWQIIESPPGSAPVLSNSSNANATFATPVAGSYRVEVVVEDGKGGQASGVIGLSIGGVLPAIMSAPTVLPDLFSDTSIPDYYAPSNVSVREGLTLNPGVVIEFGSDVLFSVSGNPAFLKAEGTPANKVILRGMNPTKGSWRGIGIASANISNSLNHVEILHAGSSDNGARRAAIRVQSNASSRLSIQNTSISETAGHALFIDGSDGVLSMFSGNDFSNNDLAPIRIAGEQLFMLDKQSVYSSNGVQAIEVAAPGNTTSRIMSNGTIMALGVPYHFQSTLEIVGTVSFEPGVICLFNSNLRLNVHDTGAIIADGTASQPIIFSGLAEVQGAWRGIEIASPSSQNLLNYTTVSYGGSTSGRGANIYMFGSSGGSRLVLTNSTISYSQTYGIRTAAGNAVLTESDNIFIANASGDIRID